MTSFRDSRFPTKPVDSNQPLPELCRKCSNPLITQEEQDYGLCEGHIEGAIEDYLEARDWNYWHGED